MNGLIQQTMSGLAVGGVYACLALALVMIHQTTHLVNFAQGEMAMFSTYMAWTLVSRGVPWALALVITVGVSFVAGMALERLLMRRFRAAPLITTVIVMIGLMILLNGLVGMLFGYEVRSFESPFETMDWLGTRWFSPHEAGVGLITLGVLGLVFVFFRYTRTGLAMRGAAANALSSSLVGVNVGLILALGWGLAAAIGAVAGVLTAPIVYLEPHMMLNVMIYAFAGAVLGGISNAWGAVVGGLLLGVSENLMGAYVIGSDLKLVFVLALIVAVLTLKPDGLFGRRVVTRV
ncbi:branched-chain amino acid ABC transporter permease [Pseudorhodoferax sp.]|uniref:branched-chain amino acid ABC transporter permease n=1 Tax=Pseudorhodoferax sp. TaxID=1993553 RepID=UPI002DD6499E|nr:branched-chain amino acid ABC transporter permease [Pseudorhodoferax sp.]